MIKRPNNWTDAEFEVVGVVPSTDASGVRPRRRYKWFTIAWQLWCVIVWAVLGSMLLIGFAEKFGLLSPKAEHFVIAVIGWRHPHPHWSDKPFDPCSIPPLPTPPLHPGGPPGHIMVAGCPGAPAPH